MSFGLALAFLCNRSGVRHALLALLVLLCELGRARALTVRYNPDEATLPELARKYQLDYDVLRKVNRYALLCSLRANSPLAARRSPLAACVHAIDQQTPRP